MKLEEWVEYLIVAIVALAGVIMFLYRQITQMSRECREDSKANAKQHVENNLRIGRLEGRHDAIEELSLKTIEAVHQTKEHTVEAVREVVRTEIVSPTPEPTNAREDGKAT